ncbi:MAG: FCD domain-containing protein, partial [Candidatus Acidiferrales bacterium]
IKKTDVTRLVIERLRYLLEKEVIGPGSKLPTEYEMSKALGVSRPSLRQAYKALDILGIIRAAPGDGTYINESTSTILSTPLTFLMLMKKIRLDEVFEFRILLEAELAALAASSASDEEIEEMKIRLEAMKKCLSDKTREGYLKAEYEFHNLIARAAHQALLFEIISMVSGVLWETRKRMVNLVVDLSEDLSEHRAIYRGIRSRDPMMAQRAMRKHLLTAIKLTRKNPFAERMEA